MIRVGSNARLSRSGFFVWVTVFLVISTCIYFSPSATGSGRISFDYPSLSGLSELQISGLGIGFAWPSGGGLSLGLAAGDEWSLKLGKWKLAPFVSGTFQAPDYLDLGSVSGGLKARYFDYRIGSWAISSISRAWLDSSGFKFSGNGSFSLGNLNLAYDVQLEPNPVRKGRWYPLSETSHWTDLTRGSFSGFENVEGSYLTLYGERRFSLDDSAIKWSQGIKLDDSSADDSLGMVTRLAFDNSYLALQVRGLKISGWALRLAGDKLSLGFIESEGGERYGINVVYRDDYSLGLEITEGRYSSDSRVRFSLRW